DESRLRSGPPPLRRSATGGSQPASTLRTPAVRILGANDTAQRPAHAERDAEARQTFIRVAGPLQRLVRRPLAEDKRTQTARNARHAAALAPLPRHSILQPSAGPDARNHVQSAARLARRLDIAPRTPPQKSLACRGRTEEG